jgi:uroporphyrinogen decarboxylase
MAERMSPKERVLAALRGEALDRPPISFLGHVFHRESSAHDLAEATLEGWRTYGWDFVKLNPRASYHAETWGTAVRFTGAPHDKPQRVAYPVRSVGDWNAIAERGPGVPALAEQLEAIRLVRRGLPPDVPLLETVFSPLAIAADLAESPETVLAHLREDEAAVLGALEAITETFRGFAHAALANGADGLFFATVEWGSRDLVSPAQHARYARPFDLAVLEAARGAAFNVLHVCRRNNRLGELADYPVHAFSWDATGPGNPDLAAGLRAVPGAVMGGIGPEGALQAADPSAVLEQLEAGFAQTGGRRWIVAPGCVVPPTTPPENLSAIRRALADRETDGPQPPRART